MQCQCTRLTDAAPTPVNTRLVKSSQNPVAPDCAARPDADLMTSHKPRQHPPPPVTYPGERLELGGAVGVGQHPGGQLDQRDAQRPDVGADIVVGPVRVGRLNPLRLRSQSQRSQRPEVTGHRIRANRVRGHVSVRVPFIYFYLAKVDPITKKKERSNVKGCLEQNLGYSETICSTFA